jgi:uncharacterized RDD family membrane protein YckC
MSTAPESTSPPPPQPPPAPPGRTQLDTFGMGFMPGNAELLVWVVALFVAMVVCWIADNLDATSWLQFFTFTTVAYLLSRGIAKASRVFEY